MITIPITSKQRHWLPTYITLLLLLFGSMPTNQLQAQASGNAANGEPGMITDRFFTSLQKKAELAERQLNKATAKALKKIRQQEKELYQLLLKENPEAAQAIFDPLRDSLRYSEQPSTANPNDTNGRAAFLHPWMDSLKATLSFLKKGDNAKLCSPKALQQMPGLSKQVQQLQGRLGHTEKIQAYLQERQQLIKQNILRYPNIKQAFEKYSQTIYYYKAQINGCKALLSDRKKAEAAAYKLLQKIPAFKRFLAKYSYLGNLLSPPIGNTGSYGQTNDYVTALINSNGPGALQQISNNVQAGQNQLEQLKAKLGSGGGSSDDIPSFKPNEMRKKSFFKRLSFGTNYQFTAARGTAPQMLDLGLQVAYQFSKNKQAGVGIGYRLGLGKNLRQWSFSSEGIGLRSFFDGRLKGKLYVSGGLELQYSTRFYHLRQLQQGGNWTRVALAGISKKMNLGKKASGGISLQYNFLAYTQPTLNSPWVIRYHIGRQ